MKSGKKLMSGVPAAVSYQSGWYAALKVYQFLENKQLNNRESEIFRTMKSTIYSK